MLENSEEIIGGIKSCLKNIMDTLDIDRRIELVETEVRRTAEIYNSYLYRSRRVNMAFDEYTRQENIYKEKHDMAQNTLAKLENDLHERKIK